MSDNSSNDSRAVSENGTDNENKVVSSKPRRRGGRRVVRQAGAAGAKLPVTVDEAAPARTPEPVKPAAAAEPPAQNDTRSKRSEEESAGEQTSPRSTSSRTRRRTTTAAAATPRRSRAKTKKASSEAEAPVKAQAAANGTDTARQQRVDTLAKELFSDPGTASGRTAEQAAALPPARPMTSLLFQEPVLPVETDAVRPSAAPESAKDDSEAAEAPTRSRKRRQAKDKDRDEAAVAPRRSRSNDGEKEKSDDESPAPRKRNRNRRLNAQERRAAAEVEQIEEDMAYDEVEFNAIEESKDDESSSRSNRASGRPSDTDEDDSDDRSTTRRRRRRRRGGHDDDESDTREESTNSKTADTEEDDDEAPVTRRRRRRRGSRSEEESGSAQSSSAHRSRKQQYIDEITDIEGSTRLEAKRQRRRDNRRDRTRQTLITEQDFLARRESVDRQMVVREKDRHTQISVIEDDILVEHYVSDIQEVSTVGNIYLGRVQNVLPSMEAAFVDIGKPRNGVLYAGEVNWDSARLEGHPRRIELAYHSGDPVLVQVTKDPIGHKGARLTSQVTLAGRFIVLVPSGAMTGVSRKLPERERTRLKKIVQAIAPKDMGVIIRTAAEGASEEAITKDCETLVHQWEHITEQIEKAKNTKKPKLLKGEPDVAIRVVRDIFNDDFRTLAVQGNGVYERIKDYLEQMAPDLQDKLTKWDPAEHQGADVFDQWQIDGQLRKGMERQVYLPSGGSLVIDRTEAMTTVDVNTGRFIGKGKSLEETVTRCNLEAAEEIVRQLRLRDIGGMVMIDFVDMVLEANRDLVLRRLVECLARDRTKHQVAEVTSLGLVQMTRKRVGQGLVEAFSEECPTCRGRGFILHDEPTVSANSDDPYALKGGDPFIESSKKRRKSASNTAAPVRNEKSEEAEVPPEEEKDNAPKGSTAEVRAKLAAIAAAAGRHGEEEQAES